MTEAEGLTPRRTRAGNPYPAIENRVLNSEMSYKISDISTKQPVRWREDGPERNTWAGDKRDINAMPYTSNIVQCINPVVGGKPVGQIEL